MPIEIETIQKTATRNQKRDMFSSRKFRFWIQLASFVFILCIGIEFYLWVGFIESGGDAVTIPSRPAGVEGFLPLSALISIRDWFYSDHLNTIHPASVIILLTVIALAFLFKKGFCGWICPVGFVSEIIAEWGDRIVRLLHLKRNKDENEIKDHRLKLPHFLDYPLRSVKYLLLLFFLYAIFVMMSPMEIHNFIASPYNKVADIKMLKFFTEIDAVGFWTIGTLFILSILLRGFWCRYLCPYGALLGLISLIGPGKIKRDENICISCGRCARACPSFIKVDQVKQIISDECSGCLDCIDVCPAEGSLNLSTVGRRLSPRIWGFAVVILFWGSLFVFKLSGPWQSNISTEEYIYHVERMDESEYTHPGR